MRLAASSERRPGFCSVPVPAEPRDSSYCSSMLSATLTQTEREDISPGIAGGLSIREIAKGLQRVASTVSRQVTRNGRQSHRADEVDH
jgi:hypothetical protein